MGDFYKLPRIFTTADLGEGIAMDLTDGQHHYVKNVLRKLEGDAIRLFNGRDGEYIARLERVEKKNLHITLENRVRMQPTANQRKIHLYFCPLKKERLDVLIEKAVELNATDFHPVLTHNTDVRKINEERLQAQMIEAAEQSERLDLPALHTLSSLEEVLKRWSAPYPLYAALERRSAPPLRSVTYPGSEYALLVGPAGGFTDDEKEHLEDLDFVRPVSLGETVLRSETAVICGLALLAL